MTQWNFQNKGKSGWTGKSSFVLEAPLRYLRPSVIHSVPKGLLYPGRDIFEFDQGHVIKNQPIIVLIFLS